MKKLFAINKIIVAGLLLIASRKKDNSTSNNGNDNGSGTGITFGINSVNNTYASPASLGNYYILEK
ncbi:MAG: hypothetical protein HYR66_14910 [Sphingobacteriales bacterium]|nr:hypothetical protein [Sphingobacteriales bacterium]MBI3717698.1 hypothetical protein [Sphingobacteriales bacterium]